MTLRRLAASEPEPCTIDTWVRFIVAGGQRDGRRVELFDGTIVVSPPPLLRHQRAVDRLRDQLLAAAPDELDVVTGTATALAVGTGFIPDVLVIDASANGSNVVVLDIASARLAVEIVSPSTRRNDRFVKPRLYAAAGLPFYWRLELQDVDGLPDLRPPVLFGYALGSDGDYVLQRRVDAREPVGLTQPFAVTIDTARLLGPWQS